MRAPRDQQGARAPLRGGIGRKQFRHRFACALLRLMARHELSTADVAKLCGYTRQAVSQWIHENSDPGGYALHQLYEAFGDEFRLAVATPPLPPARD